MLLSDKNPFRILDLPITSSEREITKKINTLSTYAEMGKVIDSDSDFPFLPKVEKTPNVIEEAKKQIEQGENKLFYSLFWIWKKNSTDELALEVLKEGNKDKAIKLWEKPVFVNPNKVYKSMILIENLIKDSTDWAEIDNEDHTLHKNIDEYLIERKKEANYSIPTAPFEINFEENWTIDCDIEWLAGVDNSSYGIVFGREKGSFFFLGVAGNGQYMYGKYKDWSYIPIIEWKETFKYNKWGKNHLQIKKIEYQLSLFINDELVNSCLAEPFFGNNFGFKVANIQKIAFRNFKFCNLIVDESYGLGINITSKNFSCVKNLSWLYLCMATSDGKFNLAAFERGIALAGTFFSTTQFEEYSKLIAGERYQTDLEKTIHFYIDEIVDNIKNFLNKPNGITIGQLINAFTAFPIEAKQYLNSRFVTKQIQNINREIEAAKSARKSSAESAANEGKKLINDTKGDITYLKGVLGVADFQYQIIADKLALEIVQCGIDFYNATKSDEIYLKEYEFAMSIAVTQRAKEKVKENLDSCKEWIENKHLYNCWFCGKNPPNDMAKFTTTIYKETSRSFFPTRRVQYSYLPVSIPRCNSCQNIHAKSSDYFTFAIVGCTIIGIILGALADGYWFAGLLIGAGIGWAVGEGIKSNRNSKADIKDISKSTIGNYPVLAKMLKEGWQFSKPKA